ncbi:hypothetical protein HanPSC8_Chr02g0070511 [Helianthus annuus]|nr:hypothetical protein HanPSC8_Chr02g0070511 [Helianthus annuus]
MSSSRKSHLIHKISLTALDMARYSASAEDLETTDCFLVLQEIGAPQRRSK